MRLFDYTGSSSILQNIASILNGKAPLPLDQQGNVDWGTAGQVLSTDGQGNAEWTNGGGGGNVDDVKVNGTSVVDANKIAQITSYKEVTMAEYNALPDTKYYDGVAYFIKDDVSTDKNAYPPLIFSTYEREVGVWVDGKPLYQRSYPVTFGTSNVELQLDFTPDALMFVPEGTFNKQSDGGNVVNYGFYISNDDRCQMYYRASEQKVVILSVASYIIGTGYVTLRYTKTTDTAGSGDWTTQGTHAVHYSTDEQIIGTWIDGKPLYEKTLQLEPQTVSGNHQIYQHGIANIAQCVAFDGYLFFNDGIQKNRDESSDLKNTMFAFGPTEVMWNIGTTWNTYPPEKIVITVRYTKTTD